MAGKGENAPASVFSGLIAADDADATAPATNVADMAGPTERRRQSGGSEDDGQRTPDAVEADPVDAVDANAPTDGLAAVAPSPADPIAPLAGSEPMSDGAATAEGDIPPPTAGGSIEANAAKGDAPPTFSNAQATASAPPTMANAGDDTAAPSQAETPLSRTASPTPAFNKPFTETNTATPAIMAASDAEAPAPASQPTSTPADATEARAPTSTAVADQTKVTIEADQPTLATARDPVLAASAAKQAPARGQTERTSAQAPALSNPQTPAKPLDAAASAPPAPTNVARADTAEPAPHAATQTADAPSDAAPTGFDTANAEEDIAPKTGDAQDKPEAHKVAGAPDNALAQSAARPRPTVERAANGLPGHAPSAQAANAADADVAAGAADALSTEPASAPQAPDTAAKPAVVAAAQSRAGAEAAPTETATAAATAARVAATDAAATAEQDPSRQAAPILSAGTDSLEASDPLGARIDQSAYAASRRFAAAMSQQAPTAQVAFTIARGVHEATDRIRMHLYPRELGEVEVRLDVQEERRAEVVIRAERAETVELLQRDARELQRALQAAGLDVDSGDLSFELGGGDADADRDGESQAAGAGRDLGARDGDDADRFAPPPTHRWRMATPGGVDMLA